MNGICEETTGAADAASALDVPAGPKRHVRHRVSAEDPERVAAFVLDLDALFDARAYETSVAREASRRVAAARGLDPLWTEVLALELARTEGARSALESLRVLWGEPELEVHASRAAVARVALHEDALEAVLTLRHRFKVVLATSRPRAEALRILRALGLESSFDAVVSPGEIDGSALPGHAAEAASEPPRACVWIGRAGSPTLRAARRCGMRTVSVALGAREAESASIAGEGLVVRGFALLEGLAAGVPGARDAKLDPFES